MCTRVILANQVVTEYSDLQKGCSSFHIIFHNTRRGPRRVLRALQCIFKKLKASDLLNSSRFDNYFEDVPTDYVTVMMNGF